MDQQRADNLKATSKGFKLENKVKQAWITALRSGSYSQGLYKLCSHENYCCLGVYAQIDNSYQRVDMEGFYSGLPVSTHYIKDDCKYNSCIAPEDIPQNIQDFLMKLNDNLISFNEIADLIEECL